MGNAWKSRIVGEGEEAPDQLMAHPLNWRIHPKYQQRALQDMLNEVGWVQRIIVNQRTGHVVDGHLRVQLALRRNEPAVPVLYVDLDEAEEALVLATLDPMSALAVSDQEKLAELLETTKAEGGALDILLDDVTAMPEPYRPTGERLPRPAADVPDAVFPSDNDWGVPVLDLEMQAEFVDAPVTVWGSVPHRTKMNGTWTFYTSDGQIEGLWRDPSAVLNTNCKNAVEVNFTVGPQYPRAVALWHIYRKRWIARYWQTQGLRVFADLYVGATHYELNMTGIPTGWRAYATRGVSARLHEVEHEYEMARERRGSDDVLFLVYGGGEPVVNLCRDRGWTFVPEYMDQRKGKFVDG